MKAASETIWTQYNQSGSIGKQPQAVAIAQHPFLHVLQTFLPSPDVHLGGTETAAVLKDRLAKKITAKAHILSLRFFIASPDSGIHIHQERAVQQDHRPFIGKSRRPTLRVHESALKNVVWQETKCRRDAC